MAQPQAGVVPGRLVVKFKPAAYEQAVQASPAMRIQGIAAQAQKEEGGGVGAPVVAKPLSVGLAGVDKLNVQHKAVSMYRLFPYAGRHEPMQQKFGLHLWYAIVMDESFDPGDAAEKYLKDSDIEWAEPMPVIQPVYNKPDFDEVHSVAPTEATFPNDPLYGAQWHYHNTGQTGGTPDMDINLPEAWAITKGRPEVIVGVVDSGVDIDHEDLKHNLWVNEAERDGEEGVDDDDNGYIDDIHGFNFVSGLGFDPAKFPDGKNGPAPIVASTHGTHVAGTIAAASNNSKGVAGIAGGDATGQGARIMVCQIMTDEGGSGYTPAAIAYAANNGAAILQNSWSLPYGANESIYTALKYFIAAAGYTVNVPGSSKIALRPDAPMDGGIVIFAAGNDNRDTDAYPAMYDEVLSVAATNHYGKRSYYSNFGTWIDISAPGGDTQEKSEGGVASTYPDPDKKYVYMQGTSMACPHVSGVAALVLSRYGSATYTPAMLRERLLSTARPLPETEPKFAAGKMGAGLVDAYAAVAPKSIADPTVNVVIPVQTYTGSAITPEPIVVDGASTLTKDTDYTVTYSNNINAGAATVTITGLNYYEGEQSASFTIAPQPIQVEELAAQDKTYDGTAAATITFNEEAFKSKLEEADRNDITVDYPTTGTFSQSARGDRLTVTPSKGVTLSGGNAANYTVIQQSSLTATINPKSIADFVIQEVPPQTYTGSTITPALFITDAVLGGSVEYKTDYYPTNYINNIDVGAATVVIAGMGNYGGVNTKHIPFTIVQKPIQVEELAAEDKTYDGTTAATITFNEEAFKSKLAEVDWPALTVTAPSSGTFTQSGVGMGIVVTTGAVTLSGNKAGNYALTQQQTEIKADIIQKAVDALNDLIVAPVPAQTYTGSALEPPIVVTEGANTLTPDTDYTVAYDNNINVGTASATVTTTGTGNYSSGASVTATFTIVPRDINEAVITGIPDQATYTGSAITPEPIVADEASTLTKGADYTVAYSNHINAGQATVTVTGTGNYTSATDIPFTIHRMTVEVKELAAQNKTYDGTTAATITFDETAFKNKLATVDGAALTVTAPSAGTFVQSGVGTGIVVTTGAVMLSGDKAGNYAVIQQSSLTATISPKSIADFVIQEVPPQTYTGSSITPALSITDGALDAQVTPDVDYATTYIQNIDAGAATVVIAGKGNYSGEETKHIPFNIVQKPIQVGELAAQNKTYDGTTAATITFNEAAFKSKLAAVDLSALTVTAPSAGTFTRSGVGMDIVVTTGAVTLSGDKAGNYDLTQQTELRAAITQKAVTATDLTIAAIPAQTYTGTPYTPAITVTEGANTLTPGADYAVTYDNNTSAGTASATVTITDTGNYTGGASTVTTFLIHPKGINEANISVSDETYTGVAIEPEPIVADGASTLTKGADYTVTYSNNINAGAATVTIAGINNYTATQPASFTIQRKTVTAAELTIAAIPAQTYTGTPYTPAITVTEGANTLTPGADYAVTYDNNTSAGTASATVTITNTGNYTGGASTVTTFLIHPRDINEANISVSDETYTGSAITPDPIVADGASTLTKGADYTVTYSNNINAGAATVTIAGINNYTATQPASFTIQRKAVTAAELTIAAIPAQTYTGSALEPAITVTEGANTLTPGADYAVTYSNNTNAGTASATVTITNTGNYTGGASVAATFTIAPRDIHSAGITIAAIPAQTYTGTPHTPAITVTDHTIADGTVLSEDTDYTVAYSNNVNAGAATVTIAGINNYTATQPASFTIQRKAVTAAELTIAAIPAQTYTGSALEPAITVTEGTNTLTPGADYAVTYSNNTNAGTASATVTITNTGNYTGGASVAATFTIAPRDIHSAGITIAAIPAEPYTGSAITPEPTVVDGARVLTKDTDYTLEYIGNMAVGQATVTVAGMVNYTGRREAAFDIVKANQTIDFSLEPFLLLSSGTYLLQATATSGLPVTCTSSNPAIADVDGEILLLKQAGTVTITATQEGDENYNAAPAIAQQVSVEESGNVNVSKVTVFGVDGTEIDLENNRRIVMGCDDASITVVVTPEDPAARVYYDDAQKNTFHVTATRSGVDTISYAVASGAHREAYTLEIAKPFAFDEVVVMRWNNTLTVINNPANNGGHTFTSFKWYGNGRFIADGQSFSAGNLGQYLEPSVRYHVVLTADQYSGELPSCPSVVKHTQAAATRAYPNPVPERSFVFVEIDGDEAQLNYSEIEIFNVAGASMGKVRVTGRITPVNMSALPTGMYLLHLRGENDRSEIIKVVVQ